ncbi:MAG TPA: MotA/TolQ/ExbB proton channel family protein, partial [Polyangiaceae bacterium]
MNLFDRLSGLTQFGSAWILWLLVCLSIFAFTVAIERGVLFFSSRDDVLALRRELRQLLGDGNIALARKRLEHSPSFEARVAVVGLDAENAASAEERMRGENQVARLAMERNLAFLGTLGNNAPFIGLLGTVI